MTKETILLVDDSIEILEGLKMILELQNYEVLTAKDEDEMHAMLASRTPSVIILDIFVAGKDGRNICRELKNTPEKKHIKIILTSAANHVLEDYKSFHADDYLEKPFGMEEVFSKIEDLTAKF